MFLGLFSYIHRHTRLESSREFIPVDDDFINQLPELRLIVFDQGSGIFPQESVRVNDAFTQLIPFDAFQLLLLILTKVAYLLDTVRIVGSGVGQPK